MQRLFGTGLAALFALGLAACPDEEKTNPPVGDGSGFDVVDGDAADGSGGETTDLGTPDAEVDTVEPDVPKPDVVVDVPITDDGGGSPDATPDAPETTGDCGGACTASQSCVSGVCVDRCPDGDLEQLLAALGPGLKVKAQFCRDTSATWAWLLTAGLEVIEVEASESGSTTTMSLRRWPFYTPDGPNQIGTLATATASGKASLWEVFPGEYLALGGGGTRAVWGYATANPGIGGEVLYSDVAPNGTTAATAAPANFGADVTGDTLVVNAFAAGPTDGGPGLYLVDTFSGTASQAVTNVGSSLGPVYVHQDLVALVVGYSDAWAQCDGTVAEPPEAGTKVFALPWPEVAQAAASGAPVNARCIAQELDLPPDTRILPDGRLLTRTDGLQVHYWTLESGWQVTVGSTSILASGGAFKDARAVPGTNLMLLQHELGYVLVEGPPPMEAITPPDEPEPDPGPEPGPEPAPETGGDAGAETAPF